VEKRLWVACSFARRAVERHKRQLTIHNSALAPSPFLSDLPLALLHPES